jgi:hypothetical protein
MEARPSINVLSLGYPSMGLLTPLLATSTSPMARFATIFTFVGSNPLSLSVAVGVLW